jgi:glucose/arabinose dehydrogenase
MKKIILLAAICFTTVMYAQTPTVVLTQVANITTTPTNKITCIANCGDSRLFFTEAPGRIKFFDPYASGGVTTATTFLNIVSRVKSTGNEQGLLGLAFAPDYATSGRFYVNYTNQTGTGNTTVSRFTVSSDPNAGNAASEEILFTVTQPYSNHNGGNIAFGPDGYLYIGMGDGGSGGDPQGYAQNGASLLGKMLRIDVSGATGYSIPSSNPFLTSGDNILDEIWATGLRNPWRFSFDRSTGDLWIGDVGQDVYEEVDYIQAPDNGGQNYGWKCREGLHAYSGANCTVPNRTDPVFEYAHSTPNGCSITGGFVDRGSLYASLNGRYFVTDYCSGRIWSLIPNGSGLATSTDHGVYVTFQYTTFGEDSYGEVYLAQQNGRISRLTTPNGSPMALINADGALAICPGTTRTLSTGLNPLLSYQWYKDDVAISGATNNQYAANEAGTYKVEVTRTGAPTATSEALTITVFTVPELTASPAFTELCEDAAFPISLTGSPSGGTFSGTGVVDGNFNPFQLGAGTYTIAYNYTTSDGCDAIPADFDISLLPLPQVTLSIATTNFCIDSALEPLVVTPEGGQLNGTGISNNSFDPATAGIGEFVINYTYADANSCAGTASLTLNVESCLSIEDAKKLGIQIFPNPFKDKFQISLEDNQSAWNLIEVFSITGQRCYSKPIQATGKQQIEIDLSAQPAGVYLLRIQGESHQEVIKLIQE